MRLPVSSLIGIFFTAVSLGAFAAPGQDRPPNILFIITDEQTRSAVSATGNPYVQTPNLDRLAARGTRFDKAYCTDPLCSPSRASLITSRMPHDLGITGNYNFHLPKSAPTMGEIFRDAGYRTVWLGKWHLPESMPGFHGSSKQAGFDFPELKKDAHEEKVARSVSADPPVAAAALKFFAKKQDKPFLLVTSFLNPHDICDYPNAPRLFELPPEGAVLPPLPDNFNALADEPPGLRAARQERYEKNRGMEAWDETQWRRHRWVYFNLCKTVDALIGQVLDALEKSEYGANTLIIFTSDHGEMNAAHRLAQKTYLYEESVAVPLIVCPPGNQSGGVNTSHLVSGLDILPTMCDYAGVKAPSSLAGRTLRPLIEQRAAAWRDHLIAEQGNDNSRMVRTERYKYIVFRDGPNAEQFFDLQTDPGETKNLVADESRQSELAKHRQLLAGWIAQSRDTFVIPKSVGRGEAQP